MRFVRALLLIACLALVALSHAPVSSNALLTDSEAVGGNVFTTGYWALIGELVGGDGHTCAVKATGDVWCWGRGGEGQLGDGLSSDSSSPLQVTAITAGTDLAAGQHHTCAVDAGQVWCWGRNDKGQLGDNTTTDRSSPVATTGVGGIGTLVGIDVIAAGQKHTCAAASMGSVYCWGDNPEGQLGDGTTTDRVTPVEVFVPESIHGDSWPSLTFDNDTGEDSWVGPWTELGESDGALTGVVSVQSSSCASTNCLRIGGEEVGVAGRGVQRVVDMTGANEAWLEYSYRRTNTDGGGSVAVEVSSDGSSWTQLASYTLSADDGSHTTERFDITAHVSATTNIRIVGSGTADGFLHVDDVQVEWFENGVVGLAGGLSHTCAVLADGDARCWGRNDKGQLGDGTTTDSESPSRVARPTGESADPMWQEIVAGDAHTCGRTAAGAVFCWGDSPAGELAPAVAGEGTAVWTDGNSAPRQRVYSAPGFDTEYDLESTGAWRTMDLAAASTRDEAIAVGVHGSEAISAQIWTGSWATVPFNDLASVTDSFWWSQAVEYEAASDDAVVVWNNGSTGTAGLSYRTFDGSTWSNEANITTPLSGEPKHMRLAAHPTTDEMVLVVSNSSSQDYAFVWNGSSWGNSVTLDSVGTGDDRTDISVAYEQSSGHAVVVYGDNSSAFSYRVWDGTTWSAASTRSAPTTGLVRWTTMASDPTSDRLAVGVLDRNNDVWVSVWDGSTWSAGTTMTTSSPTQTAPTVAVAFEEVSGDLLATYGESGVSTVRYRTWTSGGGWTTEIAGPSIGATPNSMILVRGPSDRIMLAVQDSSSDLSLAEWDGGAWLARTEVETDTMETKNQPFDFSWGFVGLGDVPTQSSSPHPVIGPGGSGRLDGVQHLGVGGSHTCASDTVNDALYCWGSNSRGQLGDDSTTDRSAPTQVLDQPGTGSFTADKPLLVGRREHSCAVDPSGDVWCWGRNDRGQVGDGTTTEWHTPHQTLGF